MFRGEANLEFSRKYGLAISLSVLLAVLTHVAGAVYSPPYAPTPYRLREDSTEAVEIPDDITIAPPPKEIVRPNIPQDIEESEDASEEETIDPTDFDPFEPPDVNVDDGAEEAFFAFDSPPEIVKSVQPQYPDLARQAQAEGKVSILVTISETGRVTAAKVYQSEVIPSLERAAVDAAKKHLSKPAKQRDRAVKCQIVLNFNFRLN
jgi:protein TonB